MAELKKFQRFKVTSGETGESEAYDVPEDQMDKFMSTIDPKSMTVEPVKSMIAVKTDPLTGVSVTNKYDITPADESTFVTKAKKVGVSVELAPAPEGMRHADARDTLQTLVNMGAERPGFFKSALKVTDDSGILNPTQVTPTGEAPFNLRHPVASMVGQTIIGNLQRTKDALFTAIKRQQGRGLTLPITPEEVAARNSQEPPLPDTFGLDPKAPIPPSTTFRELVKPAVNAVGGKLYEDLSQPEDRIGKPDTDIRQGLAETLMAMGEVGSDPLLVLSSAIGATKMANIKSALEDLHKSVYLQNVKMGATQDEALNFANKAVNEVVATGTSKGAKVIPLQERPDGVMAPREKLFNLINRTTDKTDLTPKFIVAERNRILEKMRSFTPKAKTPIQDAVTDVRPGTTPVANEPSVASPSGKVGDPSPSTKVQPPATSVPAATGTVTAPVPVSSLPTKAAASVKYVTIVGDTTGTVHPVVDNKGDPSLWKIQKPDGFVSTVGRGALMVSDEATYLSQTKKGTAVNEAKPVNAEVNGQEAIVGKGKADAQVVKPEGETKPQVEGGSGSGQQLLTDHEKAITDFLGKVEAEKIVAQAKGTPPTEAQVQQQKLAEALKVVAPKILAVKPKVPVKSTPDGVAPTLVPRKPDGSIGPYGHMSPDEQLDHVIYGDKPAYWDHQTKVNGNKLIKRAKEAGLFTNVVDRGRRGFGIAVGKTQESLDTLLNAIKSGNNDNIGRALGYTEADIAATSDPAVVTPAQEAPVPAPAPTGAAEDAGSNVADLPEDPPEVAIEPVGETPQARLANLVTQTKAAKKTKEDYLRERLTKAALSQFTPARYTQTAERANIRQTNFPSEERMAEDRVWWVDKTIKFVHEADPTPQGKYRDWLTNMAIRAGENVGLGNRATNIMEEDIEKIRNRLEQFDRVKKSSHFKGERDINKYPDFPTLARVMDANGESGVPNVEFDKLPEGVTVSASETPGDPTKGFAVVKVVNPSAMKRLGRGTDWCVTDEGVASGYINQHQIGLDAAGEFGAEGVENTVSEWFDMVDNGVLVKKLPKHIQRDVKELKLTIEEGYDSDIHDPIINRINEAIIVYGKAHPEIVKPLLLVTRNGKPFVLVHEATGQFKDIHDGPIEVGDETKVKWQASWLTADRGGVSRVLELEKGVEPTKEDFANLVREEDAVGGFNKSISDDKIASWDDEKSRFGILKVSNDQIPTSDAIRIRSLLENSGVKKESFDYKANGNDVNELMVLRKPEEAPDHTTPTSIIEPEQLPAPKLSVPDDPNYTDAVSEVKSGELVPSIHKFRERFGIGNARARAMLERLQAEGHVDRPVAQASTEVTTGVADATTYTEEHNPDELAERIPTAEEIRAQERAAKREVDFSKVVGELPEDWGAKGWKMENTAEGLHKVTDPDGNVLYARGTSLYRVKGDTTPLKGTAYEPEIPEVARFSTENMPSLGMTHPSLINNIGDIDKWSVNAVGVILTKNLNHTPMDLADIMLTKIDARNRFPMKDRDVALQQLGDYLENIYKLLSVDVPAGEIGPDEVQGMALPKVEAFDPSEMLGMDPDMDSEDTVQALLSSIPLSTTSANTVGGKETDLTKVVSSVKKLMETAGSNAPLRHGSMGGKKSLLGMFKVKQNVVRTRVANDITTLSHEAFHAIAKSIFGYGRSNRMRNLPGPVKLELVTAGRGLYGTKVPQGGYASEGWAEFGRRFLTTDDAQTIMPETYRYFTEDISRAHPELVKAAQATKKEIDIYRGQGSEARVRKFQEASPSTVSRFLSELKGELTSAKWVDSFGPLYRFTQSVEAQLGGKLPVHENPALVADALRMTHHGVTRTMVEDGMVDMYGNIIGPPLEEIFAPIRNLGKDKEFSNFLLAQRAKERIGKSKEPGIALSDAQDIINAAPPEFHLVAGKFYHWFRGVLSYARGPAEYENGLLINDDDFTKIVQESTFYVPMIRLVESDETGIVTGGQTKSVAGSPLRGFHGSGLRVRDIMESVVGTTSNIIKKTHDRAVIEALLKIRQYDDVGEFIEEIPRDKVPVNFTLDHIKGELAKLDLNIDEQYWDAAGNPTNLDKSALMKMFLPSTQMGVGSSARPVIPLYDTDGKLKWFYVNKDLYEALHEESTLRGSLFVDLIFAMPSRILKMGTTGLRPAFSLIRNPARDIPSLVLQTQSSKNPAELTAMWFKNILSIISPRHGNEFQSIFRRWGNEMSQSLGIDTIPTKRASRRLFEGKVIRILDARNWVDALRDLLQVPESTSRATEIEAMLGDVGWKKNMPLTMAIRMGVGLASKRVTTDFSAAGKYGRYLNRFINFFNPMIQGPRTFFRTLSHGTPSQRRKTFYKALMVITVPTLIQWYRNRNKSWYRKMPYVERFSNWNLEMGDQVVQLPKPFEWGSFFSVVPEVALDSWYARDPVQVEKAFGYILGQFSPFGTPSNPNLPVIAKVAKEQIQNKIDFSGAPILSQLDMEMSTVPGEQRGPYTSTLAKFLGDTFPGQVSPKRVDAFIRGFFGGLGTDVLTITDSATRHGREMEPRDIPVVGTVFRRAGTHGTNKDIDAFYTLAMEMSSRHAVNGIYGNKETRLDAAKLKYIADAKSTMALLMKVYKTEADTAQQRNAISDRMGEIAADALELSKSTKLSDVINHTFKVKMETKRMERTLKKMGVTKAQLSGRE